MRKIIKIEPTEPVLPRRKRVAAYARVSMECERLMHSMSAQISYYSEPFVDKVFPASSGVTAVFKAWATALNAASHLW